MGSLGVWVKGRVLCCIQDPGSFCQWPHHALGIQGLFWILHSWLAKEAGELVHTLEMAFTASTFMLLPRPWSYSTSDCREGWKCSLVFRRRENKFVDCLASYHMDLAGFITVNIICLLNLISVTKLIIIGKVLWRRQIDLPSLQNLPWFSLLLTSSGLSDDFCLLPSSWLMT